MHGWECFLGAALGAAIVNAGCAADEGDGSGARGNHATAGDGVAGDGASAGISAAAGSDGASGMGGAGDTAVGSAGGLGTMPGTFEPGADLDPKITFTWKESLPGQGTCKPGKYTGMFQCEYVQMGQTMPLVTVAGPVSLTLTKSMSGEFLEVSDGQLDGVAQGVIGFSSMLAGKLDCASLAFEADAVQGIYGFGDPKLFPFGTFEGGLEGTLDTGTLVLSGEWALTESSGGICKGPWTASYTP